MKKTNLLAVCFAVFFLANFAAAIQEPPKCGVVEKPAFVEISCEDGLVTISGLTGHSVELVKSPLAKGSEREIALGRELKTGFFMDRLPVLGDYEILIDGGYSLKFSYGEEILLSNQTYAMQLNLFLYGGAICCILGAAIFLAKKRYRVRGAVIAALGVALLLMYAISSVMAV